jgi:hypothetical protein
MKVRSLLFGMLCMLALGVSLASCSDDDDDSLDDGGSKVTLPQTRRRLSRGEQCRTCLLCTQ